MARLCDLRKFLMSKNPTRVQKSKTSLSEYYRFGPYMVRISDHVETNVEKAHKCCSVVPNMNNDSYTISIGFRTFTADYKETKKIIEGYLWFFPIMETPQYLAIMGEHSYREEYSAALEQITALTDLLLEKDKAITKLRNNNNDLIHGHKKLANIAKDKVEVLKNKTIRVRELEHAVELLSGRLTDSEERIKDLEAYELEIKTLKEENEKLLAQNTELKDKQKFVESRVSELLSGL